MHFRWHTPAIRQSPELAKDILKLVKSTVGFKNICCRKIRDEDSWACETLHASRFRVSQPSYDAFYRTASVADTLILKIQMGVLSRFRRGGCVPGNR